MKRRRRKQPQRSRLVTTSRPETPRFGRRHTILALLVSLVLVIGGLEVGTRLLRPQASYEAWRRSSLRYVYNPEWHWSLRPGTYDGPQGTVHINSFGIRGGRIVPQKDTSTLRVICLGGSSTFNYGAADDRTWPARLQAALQRQLGRRVEVINGGTPGYSLFQSSLRFQYQFSRWQPDLVIVYHMWNDLKNFWTENTDSLIAKWEKHGRYNETSTLLAPSPALDWLSRHSQFVTYARFAWVEYLKKKHHVESEGWVHPRLDKHVTETGVAFYRDNLLRICRLCERLQVPLLIVDQPLLANPGNSPSERARIQYQATGFTPTELQRAVESAYAVNDSVARSSPVAQHVTTTGFPRSLRTFSDHVHLRDAGLDALARILTPPCAAVLRNR
jgi:lysophospholipase L1-like esterase